ncbi:DUF3025 domain-containing protein, partial [Burkholderia sp. SIMBA_042]
MPGIDWTRPWFRPFAASGVALSAADPRAALDEQAVAAGLANANGQPLRFVPQSDLPDGVAYEAHIHA